MRLVVRDYAGRNEIDQRIFCPLMELGLTRDGQRLSLHNNLTIFKLLIRPILTYAAPVWSNTSLSNYRHLQVLQSKCLRVIGDYPRRTAGPSGRAV